MATYCGRHQEYGGKGRCNAHRCWNFYFRERGMSREVKQWDDLPGTPNERRKMSSDEGTASSALNDKSFTNTTDVARAIARSDGKNYDKLPEKIKGDYTNRANNALNNLGNVERKGRSQWRKVKGK